MTKDDIPRMAGKAGIANHGYLLESLTDRIKKLTEEVLQ